MKNINEIVATLQETLRSLSGAAQVSHDYWLKASTGAHELEQYMMIASENIGNENLRKFFTNSASCLKELHEFVAKNVEENQETIDGFKTLLAQAQQNIEQYLVPMMSAFNGSQTHPHVAGLETMIPALAVSVFNYTKHVYNEFPNMNKNEKIAAVLGVVAMGTGLAMAATALLNPVSCPVTAAVAVIGFGMMLCKYALNRIEQKKQADNIPSNAPITEKNLQANLEAIKNKYGKPNPLSKPNVSFNQPTSANPAAKPETQETTKPGLMDKIKQSLNDFFASKKS